MLGNLFLEIVPCTIERTGKTGRCVLLKDCSSVVEEYKNNKILPTVCDRELRTICCPEHLFAK